MKHKLTEAEEAVISSVYYRRRVMIEEFNKELSRMDDGLALIRDDIVKKHKLSASKEWEFAIDPDSGHLVLVEVERAEESKKDSS